MDIRISSYRPTVPSNQNTGVNQSRSIGKTEETGSLPAGSVQGVQQTRSNQAFDQTRFATTETRGTLINILA